MVHCAFPIPIPIRIGNPLFQMNDEGVEILLNLLQNKTLLYYWSIKSLHLNSHNITNVGAGYIAEFLKNNETNVTEIMLEDNPIQEEGALMLLSGLPINFLCFFFCVSYNIYFLGLENNYTLRSLGPSDEEGEIESNYTLLRTPTIAIKSTPISEREREREKENPSPHLYFSSNIIAMKTQLLMNNELKFNQNVLCLTTSWFVPLVLLTHNRSINIVCAKWVLYFLIASHNKVNKVFTGLLFGNNDDINKALGLRKYAKRSNDIKKKKDAKRKKLDR
jgi:hypothetical protein